MRGLGGGRCGFASGSRGTDTYFIAPAGGGRNVEVAGGLVRAITPSAPLGKALLGKMIDDDVEQPTPQGPRELTIVELW